MPIQSEVEGAPGVLRVAVAQTGLEPTPQENLAKISSFTRRAAERGARVVVFPEGALRVLPEPDDPATLQFLGSIRQEAIENRIYLMLGLYSQPATGRGFNWMVVVDPEGQEILRYEKVYDRENAGMPRLFYIDGIPCNAFICADRWLRGVSELPIIEGARISFELAMNFQSEWVPGLEWFWHVPRALRNNVFVVTANTAANPPSETDHHGHSSVVDPNGVLIAAAPDEAEQMLVADLDLTLATRYEAERRRNHPVFRDYWEMAQQIRDGQPVEVSPWNRFTSPTVDVTIAIGQMAVSGDIAANAAKMERMIADAAANGADVIAFPELAVTGTRPEDVLAARPEDLDAVLLLVQREAKGHEITVVFGMPTVIADAAGGDYQRANSAFVIGPDGSVLTRYDQMVVQEPGVFSPGLCPAQMWFKVKGVPAVVTVGREALWNSIGEMAAFAGAQLFFNLAHLPPGDAANSLQHLQIGINFASFFGLTAVVNGGRAIRVRKLEPLG